MKLSQKQKAMLGVLSPGFGGTSVPAYIKDYLKNGLGAVPLFASNTPDFETATKLIAEIRAINPDCVISIDEESGDVTRLWAKSGSPFPAPYLLGRLDDAEFTKQVFRQLGARLAIADIDVTFGPVFDLSISDDNPIVGVRSFGRETELVTKHGTAAVAGLSEAGISCSPKHFPGHGKTSADSHKDLPLIDLPLAELMEEDMRPFRAAIERGVKAIMVGHLLVPSVDSKAASLSKVWCRDILRGQLKFDGAIVTDALDMGALGGLEDIDKSALAAVRAGANLLCLSGIADQSKILAQILDLAEKELTNEDLELIDYSKQKISTLRRNQQTDVGLEDLSVDYMAQGFAVSGESKLKPGSIAVLTLGAEPTIASGHISWGLDSSLSNLGIEAGEFDTAQNRIIQFRDAWRDPVILERLMMLKQTYPDAKFVDFGWPTNSFTAKNLIRAFGATRAHSDGVANLLLSQGHQ